MNEPTGKRTISEMKSSYDPKTKGLLRITAKGLWKAAPKLLLTAGKVRF